MTLRGATGEIRWAYMTAAAFGPWRLEEDDSGVSVLTGTLVSMDEYRAAQAPLKAVVMVGRQRLTWPIVDLQFTGQTVTARLGQRET